MTTTKTTYRYHNFDQLWKYFPLQRSIKEKLKCVLFTCFPFVFKRWVIYQNWKNAQVYKNKDLRIFNKAWWKRRFLSSYPLTIDAIKNHDQTARVNNRMAAVVHVFYPDIFAEILNLLSQPKHIKIHLYLTGEARILDEIKKEAEARFTFVSLFPMPNHGRDILPFLNVLPRVFEDGHQIVLKLHTKGSNHLNRKDLWRHDLFAKLIGQGKIDRARAIFDVNPEIGMIGPTGNILPMHNYYGSNAEMVSVLSQQMGLKVEQLADLNFVAGSMFYARKEALLPILQLNFSDQQFEPEAGQKDGTLAHAIERLFAAGLIASNLQLADTAFDEKKPELMVSKNHYFSI